jgi:hypothetical protein
MAFPVDGGIVLVQLTGEAQDAQELVVRRLDQAGSLVREFRLSTGARRRLSALPSPDGSWLAWQDTLPLGSPIMSDVWPVVTLMDLETGEVVLRVVRASMLVNPPKVDPPLQPGQFGHRTLGWLSDGSGLLLDTAGGVVVLRPDGTLQQLPLGPTQIPLSQAAPAPVPAPHDPDLWSTVGA